ncbi:cell wall protein [Streptomyces sp. URMC 123]|uniref:cell wall protein n=1 Tax=Streptomyces sp. URMC 123 TaxID=3423403 RepID=UPI003F1A407A
MLALTAIPLGVVGTASAEPTPGSDEGGTPGPSAPAGYEIGTELPKTISVDNGSGNTTLTATVKNKGDKETGAVRMSVVGFEGLTVKAVEGCAAIPEGKLPEGSNSGFSCPVGPLGAGKSKTYQVTARYDLKRTGRVCLPVTLGETDTLLWQQGPVPFGTTKPTPNAPDTPLQLGTKNVPASATGDGGGTSSPSPGGQDGGSPGAGGTGDGKEGGAPSTGGKDGGKDGGAPGAPGAPSGEGKGEGKDRLPRTGAPDAGVMAALAAALLTAGGAGVWLTRARRDQV